MKIKKIGALVLALVMVLAMSSTAFADGEVTLTGGVVGTAGGDAQGNTVRLLKELTVFNTAGKAIYLPEISYTYVIREATAAEIASKTVTDGQTPNAVTAVVYTDDTNTNGRALQTTSISSGVAFGPAVTTGYVDASGAATTISQPLTAPVAGTSVYRPLDITFVPANFDHSGVYRYVITETSTLGTSGVTDEVSGTDTRYLDVYVRSVESSGSVTYAIYGYVCFTTNDVINASDTSNVAKTTGFVHSNDTLASDTASDKYYTTNLEVDKVVSGTLGQKNHEFPFTVTLGTATTVTGGTLNIAVTNGTAGAGITDSKATFINDAALHVGLKDGGKIEIFGIPTAAAATAKVKETNDTYDTYTLTGAKENTTTDLGFTSVSLRGDGTTTESANNTKESAALIINNENNTNTKVTYTNDLTEISPTGVVLRIAPYALMLAVGVVLLVLARRRKSEPEEA